MAGRTWTSNAPGIVLGGVAAILATCGWATAIRPLTIQEQVTRGTWPLETYMHGRVTRRAYVEQTVNQLRDADVDGDGLDRGDVEEARRISRAVRRAEQMSAALRFDLNGDLAITALERDRVSPVRASSPLDARIRRTQLDTSLAPYDGDENGFIDLKEIVAASERRAALWSPETTAEALFALPMAKDGKLTVGELTGLALATFSAADRDSSGVIEDDESRGLVPGSTRRPSSWPAADVYCRLPRPGADEEILVFGAGAGRPREWSGDENYARMTEAGFITVNIEPGSKPIYLILTSGHGTRWRIEGAVQRLSNVIVTAPDDFRTGERAHVSGVRSKLVQIRPTIGCVGSFQDPASREADDAKAAVKLVLGRAPNRLVGAGSVREVSLPSGRWR